MNNKEQEILNIIINYYKKNQLMPSIRFIKDKIHANSTNTVYYYLNKLEEKKYIKRNSQNKRILNKYYNDSINELKIIKTANSYETVNIILNTKKECMAYKIKNNKFQDNHIIKDDILIIEKGKVLNNNDLGLFLINNKYCIKKYFYQDGFFILEDDKQEVFNYVNIIGKVISVERKIK